jgi:PPK2 family polyphosphate:nucleotide phosphotransferase
MMSQVAAIEPVENTLLEDEPQGGNLPVLVCEPHNGFMGVKRAMFMNTSEFLVSNADNFVLSNCQVSPPAEFNEKQSKRTLKKNTKVLQSLQKLMWAERKQRVLVVLQAIDAGGKDGTIRSIFGGLNPQGVKVQSFKRPTKEELAHDYLWRVHKHVPGNGEIMVFNRSHYEDVLVVKVHEYAPLDLVEKRYEHIRNFEQLLADEGTTIIKIFLHISKDEQKRRFEDRLNEPDKNWKFKKEDLKERAFWDQYQDAFETMIERTNTKDAPWYVVPANNKKYRNEIISNLMIETLSGLGMDWPPAADGLDNIVID